MKLEKIIEVYKDSKTEDYRLVTELPTDIIDSKVRIKDINAFCEVLPDLFEKKYEGHLSRYLTALIQQCKSEKMSLDLPISLDFFGFRLDGKKLVINGDLGNLAFMYARNCSTELRGNAGERLGYIAEGCSFKIVDKDIGNHPLEHARNCTLEFIKS